MSVMIIEPTTSSAQLPWYCAPLLMDLWNLFLKRAFNVPPLNYCLLGRWLRHMPEGTFRHASISAAPQKRFECAVGWIAHYTIGVAFALLFVVLASGAWLARPTLLIALLYGIGTVVFPVLRHAAVARPRHSSIKNAKPMQAKAQSLVTQPYSSRLT